MPDFRHRPDGNGPKQWTTGTEEPFTPGKRTLTEQLAPRAPAQRSPAQAAPGHQDAHDGERAPRVAPPEAGIDRQGFIDSSKGAPLYGAPAEAGGQLVRDAPLPPATRVFASGIHPRLKHWWYVTAFV